MSKGNINYRYLRRRKNWFQRNWKILLVCLIAIAVIGGGIFAGIKIKNAGGIKFNKASKEEQ